MENTLVVMHYHVEEMRNILDNLIVWDGIKKVHHKNVVQYSEKSWHSLKASGAVFTITALKEAPLVFYEIGIQVQKRINNPSEANSPQMVMRPPTEEEQKQIDGINNLTK